MDKLKNIVVLKNLPSNLIDEAFLILKPNQKVKNFEYIQKKTESLANSSSKEYIIKEAEMVISSYLNRNDISNTKQIRKLEEKCKRLSITCIIMGLIISFGIIINFL